MEFLVCRTVIASDQKCLIGTARKRVSLIHFVSKATPVGPSHLSIFVPLLHYYYLPQKLDRITKQNKKTQQQDSRYGRILRKHFPKTHKAKKVNCDGGSILWSVNLYLSIVRTCLEPPPPSASVSVIKASRS